MEKNIGSVKEGMSRRSFLTGAFASGAAAAVAGLSLAGVASAAEKGAAASSSAASGSASASAAASSASAAASSASATSGASASAAASSSAASGSAVSTVGADIDGMTVTIDAQGAKHWSFMDAPDPIPDDQITNTVECDILVVGAGISGVPAAAIAAELGADVQVIEKSPTICVTRPTGFSAFGSQKLKDLGVLCTDDEKDAMIKDLWGGQNGTGKQELLQLWADRSGEYADWFIPIMEAAGIEVQVGAFYGYYNHNDTIADAQEDMKKTGGMLHDSYWNFYGVQHLFGAATVPGVCAWSDDYHDADWLTPLYQYSVDKGAKYSFATRGEQLIREDGWEEDASKRVTGCIASDEDGNYVKYVAKKGVVLATGGFDYDDEMLAAYYPIGLRMCRTWQNWFTGDGHKMALWVGAKMDDQFVSHAMGTAATGECMKSADKVMPPEAKAHVVPWKEWNMPSTAMAPCLWVNDNGERFINEETGYFMSMPRIDAQPEHMYWGVWDSEWKTKVQAHHMDRLMDANDSDERMEANVEAGWAIKADTIDELIEKMGVVDGDKFKETLDNYNTMCAAGKDTQYLKPAMYLSTVDTPPYYAAQMGGSWMTTVGGVLVDTSLHVLDANQQVIPGLFAGGNPAGGFYGEIYAPQIPMSLCGHSMTFSWLAAQNCVNEI